MWYGDFVKSIHPLPINFPPALARLPRVLRCWLAALLCKFGNVTLYLWLYRQSSSSPHTQWLMMMIWSKLSPQGVFLLFLLGRANHRRPTAIHPLMNINLCVTKEVFVLIYFRRVGNKKDTGVRYRMDEMRSRRRSEPLADWFRMQTSWSSSSAASRDQLVRLLLLLLLLLHFNIISVLTRSIIY